MFWNTIPYIPVCWTPFPMYPLSNSFQSPLIEIQNYVPLNPPLGGFLHNDSFEPLQNGTYHSPTETRKDLDDDSRQKIDLKIENLKGKFRRYKKRLMRPERKALSNIGNQILTFASSKKKSLAVLKSAFPDLSPSQINRFYDFAKEVKLTNYGYFSQQKLISLWDGSQFMDKRNFQFRILRTLSIIYIRNFLLNSIMTSSKMESHNKPLHFRIRRQLIDYFEQRKQSS